MRLLVADDHDLVRETIAAFLKAEGFCEVEGAATLDEAVSRAHRSGGFDLVLLDWNMPGMNGPEGLRQMIEANDGRPVAVLSGYVTRKMAEQAVQFGAVGFVPKTVGSRSMVAAVKEMIAGKVFGPHDLIREEDFAGDIDLSKRETEVLRGICEGKSNKEIARDLDLQEVTVKLHLKTLNRKLGARNRTHAAMIARDRNLL